MVVGTAMWELIRLPDVGMGTKDSTLDGNTLNSTFYMKNNGLLTVHNVRVTLNSNVELLDIQEGFHTEKFDIVANGERSIIIDAPRLSTQTEIDLRISMNITGSKNITLKGFASYDEKSNIVELEYNRSNQEFAPSIFTFLTFIITILFIILVVVIVSLVVITIYVIRRKRRFDRLRTALDSISELGNSFNKTKEKFVEVIEQEISRANAQLSKDITNKTILSTDIWDKASQKWKKTFFEDNDYEIVNRFYTETRRRNVKVETAPDKLTEDELRVLNQECYYLSRLALNDVRWPLKKQGEPNKNQFRINQLR